MASTIFSSENPSRFFREYKIAGKIPEEPAVGLATISPIAALISRVENAIAIASVTKFPVIDFPSFE